MGIPRLARLLIFSTLLIILPTLYLLYPHRDTILGTSTQIQDHLEQGGIDSTHWRDPLPPPVGIGDELKKLEHEEVRDWEGQDVLDQSELEGTELPSVPVLIEDSPVVSDEMVGKEVLEGGVIMPKLENATAKAELGKAAWKVLHLMTLRYPDTPTPSDREALKSYFHLFARLYPCGECAQEFQALLKEYPPQTSSRKSASMWLCHVHNLINARLGKAEFDCLTLDETYDCGCGPEGNSTMSASAPVAGETQTALSPEHQEWERQ